MHTEDALGPASPFCTQVCCNNKVWAFRDRKGSKSKCCGFILADVDSSQFLVGFFLGLFCVDYSNLTPSLGRSARLHNSGNHLAECMFFFFMLSNMALDCRDYSDFNEKSERRHQDVRLNSPMLMVSDVSAHFPAKYSVTFSPENVWTQWFDFLFMRDQNQERWHLLLRTLVFPECRFKKETIPPVFALLMPQQHLPRSRLRLKKKKKKHTLSLCKSPTRPQRPCWLEIHGLCPKCQPDTLDLHELLIALRGWWDTNGKTGGE